MLALKAPKMKYESRWYVAARTSHARALSQPMRSTARPGSDADSKAEDYARWLMNRDGVDLAALADAVRANHDTKFPPVKHRSGSRKWETPHDDAIPAEMAPCAIVRWERCESGLRPRFVEFAFYAPAMDGWRRSPARHYATIYQIELPYWDFALDPLSEAA